ncbi:hypothetical protein [Bradyrhizobium lupini]
MLATLIDEDNARTHYDVRQTVRRALAGAVPLPEWVIDTWIDKPWRANRL